MLTAKQEKYVRNLVQGMSQREAYKKSYNAINMKDETIDKRASELFAKGEIKGRYEELLSKLEDEAIMTAKERQEWLSKVIKGQVKIISGYGEDEKEYEPYMSDKLKAMDILNKMDGKYVQKIEADVNSDISINIELSDD